MKNFEEMEYRELLDYLSGVALMSLGKGDSLRNVVAMTVDLSIRWKIKQDEKQKAEEAKKLLQVKKK